MVITNRAYSFLQHFNPSSHWDIVDTTTIQVGNKRMIESHLFFSESPICVAGTSLRIKPSTCRRALTWGAHIVVYEMSIHPFFDDSIFIYPLHSCVIKPAVSLEVIVIVPCLPPWCFSKDRMNIARASAWSRRETLEEDPYGNIWDFLRSITTDSLKREIGSNRKNEFRRVVAVTRSSSLTTLYEGECNGKRDSKSLGYTSRQAIPCCYLA